MLSCLLAAQGGSSDTMLAAEEAAKKLQAQSPAPALKGETLIFDAPSGVNVSPDCWAKQQLTL